MIWYHKQSFSKIFLGYFISISIFIVLLGYLYFHQQHDHILQKVAMNMHQYILKQKEYQYQYNKENYRFEVVKYAQVEKKLPIKLNNEYRKVFTNNLIVYIDANVVDNKIDDLRIFIITLQLCILIFFGFVSYMLASISLKPMMIAFNHLDEFTNDLIHDLNTPITSILLNTTMLKENITHKSDLNKINRIENSAKNISSLYDNLEMLLSKQDLEITVINLADIIGELAQTYGTLYPNINIYFDTKDIFIKSNTVAMKRIIDNIISNSCKYSKNIDAKIEISFENNLLTIKDNGKGIKYPNKIFERNYHENDNGHGIGMHIVHTLCIKLKYKISIISIPKHGTQIE